MVTPVRWERDALLILDQRALPFAEEWIRCETPADVAECIRTLAVRGAPAIGVAAGYGLALAEDDGRDEAFELLASTRPTAVNLRAALDRVRAADDPVAEAEAIAAESLAADARIAERGLALFGVRPERVLTHCNTGPLATAGHGTALGVIVAAWEAGKVEHVWVDETRPLLQGGRLTTWELGQVGVPHSLIADAAAGSLISRGLVDRVIVGADRVAANGDVANKVGTYTLAVLCERHDIPFVVAAPVSTLDPNTPDGASIEIEERAAGEVIEVLGTPVAPPGTRAANPAFDVTPAALVTHLVTDAM